MINISNYFTRPILLIHISITINMPKDIASKTNQSLIHKDNQPSKTNNKAVFKSTKSKNNNL